MKEIKDAKILFNNISNLIEILPNKEDLENLVNSLNEIIKYLDKINKILINMPTDQEAIKTREALKKLEIILNRNPMLSEVLKKKKSTKKAIKKEEVIIKNINKEIPKEKVNEHINKLLELPEVEMRNYLEDNKDKIFTNKLLIEILLNLGVKVSKKTTKKELINHIVNTIINNRTYQGLRKLEIDKDITT